MSELDLYDYELPEELIAQQPLARRDSARLMLVDRRRSAIDHFLVRDLPELLQPGDCLVLNDTRVLPARLVGRRVKTGGRWEGLFLSTNEQGLWQILSKTRGRLQPGEAVALEDLEAREALRIQLIAKLDDGSWAARPDSAADAWQLLEQFGRVPLPHYIRRGQMVPSDRQAYQTVYATNPGAVAAPTAGLHFTSELLNRLEQRGVQICYVTLHVGIGTFRPISAAQLRDHQMHEEWGAIGDSAAQRLQIARRAGGRIVAVGTTVVRVLETAAAEGSLHAWQGQTRLFIRPPYQFRAIDALMTNFHLPRSTLLVLVRTFGGERLMQQAYQEAIQQQYRFFSYGDAMLIV